MKNQNIITIKGKNVHIPNELFLAMEKPKIIRILPSADLKITEIEKYNPGQPGYILNRTKRFLYFLHSRHKRQLPKLIKLHSINDREVIYYNNSGFDFLHYKFFIVNYHPCYYLMPVTKLAEADSREQSWEKIQEYHEHLLASLQDKNANRVSKWLASKILVELKGKSFLELGCGGGRNLIFIHKYIRGAKTIGIDINRNAIDVAKGQLKNRSSEVTIGSIYDLSRFADNSIDVVFTCGVLMHIPHKKVIDIIKQMNRIARLAVVHFELDGPSHIFDYHRYPRDYKKLYHQVGLDKITTYKLFPKTDYRSNMDPPFSHALLVSKSKLSR